MNGFGIARSRSTIGGTAALAITWALACAVLAPQTALAETLAATPVMADSPALAPAPAAAALPALVAPPAPVAPKAKKLTVRQSITLAGRQRGLSKREISALMWICKRESGFGPRARTGKYHGLFQLSIGMVRGKPWKDPIWNTKRAIKYMKGRYGGVLEAKAFWTRHRWY